MVFNSLMVLSVAHISADLWQEIARIRLQERVSSHQLLDLICCFPLQQLGSFALWLWTFLCLPPPDSFYPYSYYNSSSSSSSDEDDDHHHHLPLVRGSSSLSSASSPSVDLDDGYCYDSHSD